MQEMKKTEKKPNNNFAETYFKLIVATLIGVYLSIGIAIAVVVLWG